MLQNQGFKFWTTSHDVAATSHCSNHIKLRYCKTTLTAMQARHLKYCSKFTTKCCATAKSYEYTLKEKKAT